MSLIIIYIQFISYNVFSQYIGYSFDSCSDAITIGSFIEKFLLFFDHSALPGLILPPSDQQRILLVTGSIVVFLCYFCGLTIIVVINNH